jgi:LPS export ABC transporter protein LptC
VIFGSTKENMIKQDHTSNFLIAVAFLVSCFFIVSCENDINDVKSLGKYKAGVDVGKDVIITFSNNGKISAKLSAPILNQYLQDSGKMVEFPKSIHVDFYKDSFRLDSKLNADYAKYLQTQDKIYLKDNVVVYTLSGDTLWCKEMYWDQALGKFYTDKEVVVKQHNPITKTYGIGFEANQDLTDIKIFKVQPNSFAIINDSSSIH